MTGKDVDLAVRIAAEFLKKVNIAGDRAGRFIYIDVWRNELIDEVAKALSLPVPDAVLRASVEAELNAAWDVHIEKLFHDQRQAHDQSIKGH